MPQTQALQQQKHLSLSPLDEWIFTLLEDGVLPGALAARPHVALSQELYRRAREAVPGLRDASETRLGRHLKLWGVKDFTNGVARGREFPPLAQMREAWERQFGSEEWPSTSDWASGSRHGHEGTPF